MRERNDMECAATRDELAGLLYGELGEDERERVERHVSACEACRAELDGLGATRNLLDTWSPSEIEHGAADASAVVRAVRGKRARTSRLRTVVVGVAASVLVFFGLASMGAEVDYGGGRVALRFELPWVDAEELAERGLPEHWREDVRELAREEAGERLARWSEVRDELLADWSLREEEQRLHLARAIDNVRRNDRAAVSVLLDAVQRGAVRENQFTREALYELASMVAPEREH